MLARFNLFLFYYYSEYRILQNKKATLAAAINSYKSKQGLNYEELAKHWDVCKTTLYRAAKQDWQRPTAKLQVVADKVGITLSAPSDAKTCEPFLTVVNEIWDGTDAHAKKLARLVRDIHELSKRHSQR